MAGPSIGLVTALIMGLAGMTGGLTGLPPGERDMAYLQTAPADSLVYAEWSTRGTGEKGAEGIDGLVADPEITAFFSDLKRAALLLVEKSAEAAPPGVTTHLPPLLLDWVNRSGCFYLAYTAPEVIEERLQDELWLDVAQGLKLTFIINGGDGADETEKHLLGLLPLIMGGADVPQTLNELEIPNPLGTQILIDREETYFILALGEGALPRAHAGLKGETEGLAEFQPFQQSFQHVEMERIGTIGWLNLGDLRQRGLELAGPFGAIAGTIIQQLGLDELNAVVSTSGVIDGQIASRTYLETGGKTEGVLSLAASRGLQPADFERIPADCDFVSSFTLDVPLVRESVMGLIQQVQPDLLENYQSIEAQIETDLGFMIEEDFLQAYGQRMTLFNSPAAGGLFLTSLTFSWEVKDKEKADKVLEQLIGLLQATLPGDFSNEYSRRGVFLEKKTFLDQTIYYVRTIGEEAPVAPALCQTDHQLLLTLHPQALKAHLRFLAEDAPSYSEKFEKHAPQDGTLISYSSLSADQLVRLLYTSVPFVGQVVLSEAQSDGFEMDIYSIPSAKAILPYLDESRGWVVRTETGLLFESRSTLPIPIGSLPLNLIMTMRSTAVQIEPLP